MMSRILDRIEFVGLPAFPRIIFWVAIETMHFHMAHTKIVLRTTLFGIQGVPMSNLVPMKNCPGGARYSTAIYFQIDFIRNLNVFLIIFLCFHKYS